MDRRGPTAHGLTAAFGPSLAATRHQVLRDTPPTECVEDVPRSASGPALTRGVAAAAASNDGQQLPHRDRFAHRDADADDRVLESGTILGIRFMSRHHGHVRRTPG